MAKGFLNGALWGSVASICALALISVASDRPVAPVVTATAPQEKPAPSPKTPAEDRPAKEEVQAAVPPMLEEEQETVQPETEEVQATVQQTPKTLAPEPDTLAAVAPEATASAALPETGAASALSDPAVEANRPALETQPGETPVTPGTRSTGLQAPAAEPSISVSTDPAAPLAPEVSDEIALSEDPVQPTTPLGIVESSGFGPKIDEPESAPGIETSISVEPDQPQAPDVPTETQAFEPRSEETESTDAPKEETSLEPLAVPDSTEIAQLDEGPDVQTFLVPPIPSAPPDASQTQSLPQPDDVAAPENLGPKTDSTGGIVGNLAEDVLINRLPALGNEDASETAALQQPSDKIEKTVTASDPSKLRPVERFAADYDNAQAKPVMAIVLMDEGVNLSRDTIGLPALRSFPYPISFAVDTSLPDARERMAAYRAEGFEVLAMVNLPTGALAQDAEVSLSVALEAVPEAVAVLEGVDEGVQGTREAAQQVTEILAQTGHGFVTQNKGLNTVQKLAAKSGVPSAVIFRDFDSSGQTPTVIRRFLDQAAFRAGREGGVIMLGRLREDTISALLIWGLQDRAERVALVPVSAALQTQ
ncbi:divergent polysaccharide deacetylase family protein [Roseobacter sp.]|uniref:divergent polysaccharide deacetylase family protein n=1 Tax=Roseobacter sp. TaxID=1907202 RepID=UPI00385C91B6